MGEVKTKTTGGGQKKRLLDYSKIFGTFFVVHSGSCVPDYVWCKTNKALKKHGGGSLLVWAGRLAVIDGTIRRCGHQFVTLS